MKLALLSISVFAWLSCAPALAVNVEASIGVYYFTSNQEKIESAQLEKAEGNQAFRTERDPRSVARDLAREELAKGNVCLSQAQSDLRKALRSKLVARMCREIFQDEIASAQASAREKKWKANALRCEASVEARETPGALKLALTFNSRLMMSERLPMKLARAGFGEEPTGWVMPTHEASLGQARGWKEVLKARSCTLGENALQAHLETFLEEIKAVKTLAQCRRRLDQQVEKLGTLQAQLNQYVPAEWLADAGGSSVSRLLKALPGSDASMSIEGCRAAREAAGEQLGDLRELSESLASKHDLPALNPENLPGGRSPASEEMD